jgi:hypothetical protein
LRIFGKEGEEDEGKRGRIEEEKSIVQYIIT